MASFSSLAPGSQKISLLAPVMSGHRPTPEGTRSFSEALLYRQSKREITDDLICERSELSLFFCVKSEFSTEGFGYTTGPYI